ncbi:hypothetical protein, partial [Rhizobium leguminosarum]|uniref:hypothetical protein n=1 Tax=Rhizobium leguminosarum TaxID=384 RepID=UPI001C90BEB3
RPTSSSQSNAFNESLITMVNHVQPNTVNTKLAHMGTSPSMTEEELAAFVSGLASFSFAAPFC